MYDVVVIGLGGMGSPTAHELARRGKKVLGLEQHAPGHDRGSSHGGSRLIRQAYFEDPAYVPLVLRAYQLWERLERETGRDLMTLCGGLMLGQTGSTVLEGSLRSAREHDLPCEVLKAEDVRRRFPALAPARGTVALYEAVAGFIDPTSAMNAQLERSASLGAELRFEEPVCLMGGRRLRRWCPGGDAGGRVRGGAAGPHVRRMDSEVTRGPGPPTGARAARDLLVRARR